jgi:hypothetical protein
MKKKIYLLATALMFVFAMPTAMAKAENAKPSMTERQVARVEEISSRIEVIKSMDRSELSRQERKDLRNELLKMKKELKLTNGGIYLSVGAIIIILLILILVL